MRSNRIGGKKYTKLGGQSNSGRGIKNGHGKWKSKNSMLENNVSNQKRQLSVFNTEAKPGSDDEEFYG